MPSVEQTVQAIVRAPTFDARIAEIRKIPGRHGSDDHSAIFAEVARQAYVPHLTPDFAYIHDVDFYGLAHLQESYRRASAGTDGFTAVDQDTIRRTLLGEPQSLLTFRVICGLTRDEFAHATKVVDPEGGLSGAAVDGIERKGTKIKPEKAALLARTIDLIVNGSLFGQTSGDLMVKQNFKPDTEGGWSSVEKFASGGVPYSTFLHQRHYGGAFRQLLDATSSRRGDLIEVAVEDLFRENHVPYIRTGSHSQADISKRFGLDVRPAPDFAVYDESSDTLMAILECKGANDGGTARDKALRFAKLKAESMRLGGIPVMAVLGGIGWQRVNDTLGPVLADTDGRVFTMTTLDQMLTVAPMPQLIGTASKA